jgi:hypothetical protein
VNVLLVVATVAPLGCLGRAVVLIGAPARWRQVSCAIAAVAWMVLLVSGVHPAAGALAPDDLALAAAAGVALLATVLHDDGSSPLVGLAVAALTAGMAATTTTELFAGLAAAAVALSAARARPAIMIVAVAAGIALLALGTRIGGSGGARLVVVTAAVVGAVAVGTQLRSSIALLTPVAFVFGLRAAPLVPSIGMAIAFSAVGALLVAQRVRPLPPAVALVAWTMAAAVAPIGAAPAARALAAATVLVLATGGPAAVIAAVPGAVVLAHALAATTHWERGPLALAAAITIAGVSRGPTTATAGRLRLADALPLALAAWLVVRPTSWTWLRVTDLDAYIDGITIAVAVGMAATVATAAAGRVVAIGEVAAWTLGPEQRSDPAHDAGENGARASVLAVGAVAAIGLLAVALVR